MSVYACYCGAHSLGALRRDMHACTHMLIKPDWYKRARAKWREK